ncbi:MAG: hypothetical protein HFI38_02335 [Lachnospiraceae bacterium]|jgi:hypothetical protein|nr:hypothetical protein [Lachnospiraceae bacterium]
MKYRYKEKTYCFGSYDLIPMEPGDDWVAEGVVRFHLPAILIDVETKPEEFITGEIRVADYVDEMEEHDTKEDDEPLSEPVIAVEYGPDDWRVIDGWGRIERAVREGVERLPAVKLPSEQAMKYLVEERDVKAFIEHWNFKTAYWERRDRVNGFLMEDRPEYTECIVDPDATWEAVLAAAAGREIEIPIRWNRWFAIHGDGTRLFIGEAKHMAPVCPLTFDRQIRKKEYLAVFPLYEEWERAADDKPVREEARRITISYEYIFAMIRQFAKGEK